MLVITIAKFFVINTRIFLSILTLDFYISSVLKNSYIQRSIKMMTNLTIEILFWAILISYLGLRFSITWDGFNKQY